MFVPFFDAGRLVNKLVLDATDPLSKETDFKDRGQGIRPEGSGERRWPLPARRPTDGDELAMTMRTTKGLDPARRRIPDRHAAHRGHVSAWSR